MLQGKRLLRSWFLRPVANLAILGERHDTIEQLMKSPDIMKELQKSLKKVLGRKRGAHPMSWQRQ